LHEVLRHSIRVNRQEFNQGEQTGESTSTGTSTEQSLHSILPS
jgi:hypothetical protein